VNSLVRDYANGAENDIYFPFSRSFDWYHGHSWAKGLFESADGKDEESSSEDVFSTYAVKMWGRVIGDPNMEARGNLQLAVLARSLRNYFLMESTNVNQPANFIRNKATGIVSFVHGFPLSPFLTSQLCKRKEDRSPGETPADN
jgi:endo-1,3(4)-beta-glucanase